MKNGPLFGDTFCPFVEMTPGDEIFNSRIV